MALSDSDDYTNIAEAIKANVREGLHPAGGARPTLRAGQMVTSSRITSLDDDGLHKLMQRLNGYKVPPTSGRPLFKLIWDCWSSAFFIEPIDRAVATT